MSIRTVEQIKELVVEDAKYNLDYFLQGEGRDYGCSKIACPDCCFSKIWEAESCFSVMSRASKLNIYDSYYIGKFAEFFNEYSYSFWRL